MLQVDKMQDLDTLKQAKLQAKTRRKIQKAVEELPIASISSINNVELHKLKEAIDNCVLPSSDQREFFREYEKAIVDTLDNLFAIVSEAPPAFIIVQEHDWRWVLAFHNAARNLTILEDTNVGSRHVLLVANRSADKLISSSNSEPIVKLSNLSIEYPIEERRPR